MKKALCAVWMLLLCLMCTQAMALAVSIPVSGTTVEVCTTELEGEEWLFLPSFADLSKLYPNAAETEETGVWLDAQTGLHIMQSQNLRALFLFSADPANEGREWVESDPDHNNSATGSMMIVRQDGHIDYMDGIRSLRGRGNYTWGQQKKGYQLKIENAADLLKTGKQKNLSRVWILLGETFDGTLLRNRIVQDLALEMGMEASETEFVDLYYDGEYRGVYLIAEKVEIGQGRINELDYDELLKKWNKKVGQTDLDSLPAVWGENAFGLPVVYVDGVVENDRPTSGAYLLEWENKSSTQENRSCFVLDDGSSCIVQNPKMHLKR